MQIEKSFSELGVTEVHRINWLGLEKKTYHTDHNDKPASAQPPTSTFQEL